MSYAVHCPFIIIAGLIIDMQGQCTARYAVVDASVLAVQLPLRWAVRSTPARATPLQPTEVGFVSRAGDFNPPP